MFFSSAITSAFSFNVLCWLKATLSFYMGDIMSVVWCLAICVLYLLALIACLTTNSLKWNPGIWHAPLVYLAFSCEKQKPVQSPGLLRITFWTFSVFIESSADEEKQNIVILQWKACLLLLPFYLFHMHFWFCSVDWIVLMQYSYVTARGM